MKTKVLAMILTMIILVGCSNTQVEPSYQEVLKKRLDETLIEESSDDTIEFLGSVPEHYFRYIDLNKIQKWDSEFVIDEFTALEIGDAVLRATFDEELLEATKKYDVYELEGKDVFIVKRYNEQKSLYVAIDKTNCEIINVWQSE